MYSSATQKRVKGWLFDVYPSAFGEMAVWVISENGERLRFSDKFQPNVYASGKQQDIERLASQFYSNQKIASWNYVYKYVKPTDAQLIAAEQLIKEGAEIHAGNNITFLFKDSKNRHPHRRVVAEQLIKEGAEVHAGNNITFLFKESKNRHPHRRVIAEQLIEKDVNADTRRYLLLLYASAANLLSFKGYTEKTIHDAVNKHHATSLIKYF